MNPRHTILIFTFVATFGWASQATAVLVDLTLSAHSDGTFELYASASSGDNGGIGFYGVELLGIDTITNLGPKVDFDDTDFEPHGFHYFRSADDDPVLVGSQNILDPGSIVYEFGQTGGTLPNGWGVVQQNYSAPLLLATGTFTDETQLGFGDDILLSVFTDVGVADTIEAPVNTSITLDGSAMFFESAEDRQLRLDAAYAAERDRKIRDALANNASVTPGAEPPDKLSSPAWVDHLQNYDEFRASLPGEEVMVGDPDGDGVFESTDGLSLDRNQWSSDTSLESMVFTAGLVNFPGDPIEVELPPVPPGGADEIIPEPTALTAFLGLAGLAALRRRL